MVTLTPLSKGLIALAVIGAVASAVWHIGLKDWMAESGAGSESSARAPDSKPVASATIQTSAPAASPEVQPQPVKTPEKPPEKASQAPSSNAKSTSASPVAHLGPAESGEMGRKLMNMGDYAQARIYLEHAVQGGDGAAACLLGEMTLKGQGGLAADQGKAASLFQMAQARNIICFASSN